MIKVKTGLLLIAALMMAAFSMQSMAAKLFSFSIGSNSLVWSNSPLNQGGNSVINSVKLSVPPNAPLNSSGYVFTITNWSGTVGTLYNSPTTPTSSTPPVSVPYNVPAGATLWIKGIAGVGPGLPFVVSVTDMVSGCSGTVVFTAAAWTGNTWGGTQFTAAAPNADKATLPCSGNLGCNTDPTGSNVAGNPTLDPLNGNGTPDFQIVRDNDPSVCTVAVPFTFSFNPFSNIANFTVPEPKPEKVWVEYTVMWASQPADPATGFAPNIRPLVSWGITNPQIGTGDFVPALACPDDAFGTGDNDGLPIIPNIAPFNTSPYAQYQPGQFAKMCILQQGWSSVGSGTTVMVQYWTVVKDKADGIIIKQ